jgi:hypothetical protein
MSRPNGTITKFAAPGSKARSRRFVLCFKLASDLVSSLLVFAMHRYWVQSKFDEGLHSDDVGKWSLIAHPFKAASVRQNRF